MEMLQGLLLCLLLSTGGAWASKEPLRPPCRPTNVILAVEKEGCPVCVPFNTTICAGYCSSMVRVMQTLPPLPQTVCNYHELRFTSVRLPGCRRGVDPVVYMPMAVSCRCALCRRSYSDCGSFRNESLGCDYATSQDSSSNVPPSNLTSPSQLLEPAVTPLVPQ
uniref:Choriogonadotropin subunit beta n=3 Tax=Saimiri TaxID=9520 RepID=CGHB_SAIBB|nr:RecName: Full=Choriogonadotropin subunit beta; Short=CG-beta; AltName: Full=Chorionic gonadotrophin chain beta; Flags: Precursor [Saimiri boliviensis boliviensis]ABA00515.1 chorionic gonadotropin beta subunit [Saimiri boliviensis boliviensis]ACY71072.1 chorionic gonadotropin beta-subunit [Saimiri boliviensis]CAQ52829.1 precursor chorionic gonadotropin beta subunit [Saimiri sciureus]